MIFIIGGREQGKTVIACAIARQNRSGEEVIRVADGRTDSFEQALSAEVVLHLELFIRRTMEAGAEPALLAEKLFAQNPQAVVTADEIGYGIVPADAFERRYRETCGRICRQIAAFSDEVHRVICGLDSRIK